MNNKCLIGLIMIVGLLFITNIHPNYSDNDISLDYTSTNISNYSYISNDTLQEDHLYYLTVI